MVMIKLNDREEYLLNLLTLGAVFKDTDRNGNPELVAVICGYDTAQTLTYGNVQNRNTDHARILEAMNALHTAK